VNSAREVLDELKLRFDIRDRSFFPTRLPSVDLNLLIGITCTRRGPG
jgi:hypothetical protein